MLYVSSTTAPVNRRMSTRTAPSAALALACALSGPAAAAVDASPAAERVSFQSAVGRALQRNPTLAIAVEEIRRAEGLLRQARASSLPTLSANLAYTRLDNDRILNDRVILNANQLTGNLQASVPLLAPQRWLLWGHALDNRRAVEASAAEVRRQIAAATGRAYLTLLGLHRNLEVIERARDTARAHLDFARARLAGGIGNRLDEVRAHQELQTDEAQVQSARASLTRAQEALGVLLGADAPVDAAEEAALGEAPALPQALQDADRRTDLQAQRLRQRAADHVLRDSWADYMPFAQLVFQPFLQEPATFSQPELGWQAQLVLVLPIYDGGLRYGLRRERAALAAQARLNVEATLRQARSEVRASFEALRRADEGLRAAREAAQLAQEALRLANLAYRAGATTNLEVIDAERRARDAESAAAVSEDAARQARLDLLLASGRFP